MMVANRARIVALAVGLVGGAVVIACTAVPEPSDTITVNGPSLADFSGTNGVSAVFERNCASLDCHGSDARPLRIYSQFGLRKPPGLQTVYEPPEEAGVPEGGLAVPEEEEDVDAGGPNRPGGEPTTPEEVLANYQAIVSLEPRVMQSVVKGGDPYGLLLLKKPLLVEKHKGGPALHKNGEAELCIVGWLKNKVDKAACGVAAKLP